MNKLVFTFTCTGKSSHLLDDRLLALLQQSRRQLPLEIVHQRHHADGDVQLCRFHEHGLVQPKHWRTADDGLTQLTEAFDDVRLQHRHAREMRQIGAEAIGLKNVLDLAQSGSDAFASFAGHQHECVVLLFGRYFQRAFVLVLDAPAGRTFATD